jgi:lipoprotein-anchoring transpeptidase ErfK/SrfK
MSTTHVGNDFIIAQPRVVTQIQPLQVAMPMSLATPAASVPVPILTVEADAPTRTFAPVGHAQVAQLSVWQRSLNLLHEHSIVAFSLLILLVGSTGATVFGNYRAAAIAQQAKPLINLPMKASAIAGLNVGVAADQLTAKLQAVTGQTATLTVGDTSEAIEPDTIKSWLSFSSSTDKSMTGVHINAAAITKSVTELAQKHEKAPVNEVTSTISGSPQVIYKGKNGAKLTDPGNIKIQADLIAKTLLDAKGFAFTTPLETQAFASVTPAAYPKLIEVNVDTKQMYLYDNGQLTHTYPVSAGADATPTPIGQYKIFSKLAVQDMKGFNPNGTKYFQPHVRWINYFLPGGYAIHGNYWRPSEWFGNINSSHGCVSVPDEQAKEVFDWAPLNTPIITHHS